MEVFLGILRLWYRIAVLIMLVLILRTLTANAESAIVSFNDPEHLVALTDSVVDVCDTVKWEEPPGPDMDYQWRRITCRELVTITADWPKMEWKWVRREGNYPKIYLEWKEIDIPMEWREILTPGQAIINYRRVTQ